MKINIVTLDDTDLFDIHPIDMPFIQAIMTVYIYNPQEETVSEYMGSCKNTMVSHDYIVFNGDPPRKTRERLSAKYGWAPSEKEGLWLLPESRLQGATILEVEAPDLESAKRTVLAIAQ